MLAYKDNIVREYVRTTLTYLLCRWDIDLCCMNTNIIIYIFVWTYNMYIYIYVTVNMANLGHGDKL